MSIANRSEALMSRLTVKLMPALADLVLAFCHDCGNAASLAAGYHEVMRVRDLDMPPQKWSDEAFRSTKFTLQMIKDLRDLVYWYHGVPSNPSNSLVTPAMIHEVLTD